MGVRGHVSFTPWAPSGREMSTKPRSVLGGIGQVSKEDTGCDESEELRGFGLTGFILELVG